MFRSYWLSAIAIGLALAGATDAQAVNKAPGRNPATDQRNAAPIENIFPDGEGFDSLTFKRIARALETQVADEQSPDEQNRAERNIKAAEKVADWTPWILFVAALEMLVTFFGVILIRGTLIHTRRAANAAVAQVGVMRESSEDQLRPYVLVSDCVLGWESRWIERKFVNDAFVLLTCVNSGQTPAKFIEFTTVSTICNRGSERRYVPHKDNKIGVWGPLAGHDDTTVVMRDASLNSGARALIEGNPRADLQLFVRGEVKYDDVFGNEYVTEFEFFTANVINETNEVKMIKPNGRRRAFVMTKKAENNNKSV